MILEWWAIGSMIAGGSVVMRAAGLRGPVVPAIGLLVGVGLVLAVTLIQVVTPLPTSPVLTMVVVAGGPVVWWWWRVRRGHGGEFSPWSVGAVGAGLAIAVFFFRWAKLSTWHGDSVFYLLSGATLSSGSFYDAVFSEQFEKRGLGVAALHAVAHLHGEYFLASVTPLVAISLLVTLVWLVMRGLRADSTAGAVTLFAVLGALFLVSANRFVYHAFYLNGHLLTGAMVLMAAGALWLLWRGDPARTALVVMVLAAISTAVVTRAEGAVSMALVILPALVSSALSRRERRLILGWLAGTMTLWFGFGVWVSQARGEPVSVSTATQLGIALALGAAVLAVGHAAVDRHAWLVLVLAEAGLWAIVAILVWVRGSSIAVDSVAATLENQAGAGKWGLTIIAIVPAVILVMATRSVDRVQSLRFPVTTFVPLVIALAYAREGAYRVGIYDSLNRMWVQILPLAVAYVVVALASGSWRPWVTRVSDRFRRCGSIVRG